ncbi:MAG: apolipoprotein N-acyltransferase [Burkholderiales bacterium PBB4]|nr:MAG: apolipoprotein N-acyltransferase [Burkholderiales bacterium PBB4]
MSPPWRGSPSNSLSLRTLAVLTVAAGAQGLSIAWPWDWILPLGASIWWLQLLGLAALVAELRICHSTRQALWTGLYFATIWLCGVFWWLYIAMHTYGGLHSLLAATAVAALAGALALYYAAACALFFALRGKGVVPQAGLFAVLWMAAEMARGTWLTGFGWGAIGYAHLEGPLSAFIPWVGAYGVSALAAALAFLVAASLGQGLRFDRAVGATLLTLLALGGAVKMSQMSWTEDNGPLAVTLLQGNIPQDEKFEPGSGVPLALDWYARALDANQSALVVAPETAVPLLPQQLPPEYWQALEARFASHGQAALIGIPLGNYKEGYTNSVWGLAPGLSTPWRYDKHHLVPFGEFIPPLFKWFTQMMNIPLGDFNRGGLGQASFAWAGQRLATHICYEDLFGEELATRFTDAAAAPTIFVNLSNIGWFGNSVAIDQHLNISRMRALEFERPFVRATNTGATVMVDHAGRVTASLPRATRGILEGIVQGRQGMTPFAWWAAYAGLGPLWCGVLVGVGLAWRKARRR